MKFSVQLVSRDARACDRAGNLKEAAIPSAAREKADRAGDRIEVNTVYAGGYSEDAITRAVLENASRAEACCVIVDDTSLGYANLITPSILTVQTERKLDNKLLKNTLAQAYLKGYKRAKTVWGFFQSRQTKKFLILPRRNCACPELADLFELCEPSPAGTAFAESMEKYVKSIRGRVTPKTNTSRPETYIKDDKNRYFRLGFERHAQADEAAPPHNIYCVLAKHFRLGMRLDPFEHFNVTEGGQHISGSFEDCHANPTLERPRTHLNMFPSGFF